MSLQVPTPIPIETTFPTVPPTFEGWRLQGIRAERCDKRDYTRRGKAVNVWLIDLSGQSVLRCRTDNVSDAGLHAYAPIGFGLGVGQRYEVRMAGGVEGAPLGAHLSKSLGYATVIRTEMHVGIGSQDRIGFAVRFDSPQLLPS